MDKAAKSKGLFLVTTGATFWGISGTVSKRLFQQTEIDVNWHRRSAIQLIVFGLVGMFSVQYTYMISIQHGNAAAATLLQYLAPVMIIIYLSCGNK